MLNRVIKEIRVQQEKVEEAILNGNVADWTEYKVKLATRRTLKEMRESFLEITQTEEDDLDDDDSRVE